MLLIVPVTLLVCERLAIKPGLFLIAEVLASTSLWAGMGGPAAAAAIAPHHLALIPLTAAAGIAATLWWWRRMQLV